MSADYGEGWIETVIRNGKAHTGRGGTLTTAEFEERAAMLGELFPPLESWGGLDCGWTIGGAAAGCAVANPVACVGGSIMAACTCLPEMIDEFKDIECPGY